jgi:lathosterol oxidase
MKDHMQQASEVFIAVFTISVIRYFIIAGIAFLLCYKLLRKALVHSKIQGRSAARRDFIREILQSLKTMVVFTVIVYVALYTPFKKVTLVYTNLSYYPVWWIFVSVALSLVIHDTYFYWMHRLLHHPKIFRYAHLVHHESTNPSPWASYSFHFIEAWTEGAVLLVIVMVIPMHPLSITLFVVVAFVINVYGHLGYEIAPIWLRKTFLFEIINTSVYHNFHHSKFKGNYGLYFRMWDRLMGTEHPDYVKEYDRVQQNRLKIKK